MRTGASNAELVEQALASAAPDTELIAIADEDHHANLRWAQNGLTTNGLTRSSSLTVIAVVRSSAGVRTGSVSRSGVAPGDIQGLVAQATAQAREGEVSTAEGREALVGEGVDISFEEPSRGLDAEVVAPVIDPLAQALRGARIEGSTWSGYAEAMLDSTWVGTSAGARRVHHQPSVRVEATARSQRNDDVMVSSWAGAAAESFEQVSIPSLAEQLARGRGWSQHDVDVEPGRHTVILTAGAVADLVVPALWAASARDAVEGRSAFGSGSAGARIGEAVMGRGVNVVSDPFDPLVPSRPFALAHASGSSSSVLDNGLPLARTPWVQDGTLRHLIGPRAYRPVLDACRPNVDSIRIEAPGSGTLDDLVARTQDALLITCLWYIRDVDPQTLLLTGLTRDGVFRVKNGEIVGAAPNFRFNVSPLDLMSGIADASAAGRVLPREWGDYVHRVVSPAIRVERFNLSTRSDAR